MLSLAYLNNNIVVYYWGSIAPHFLTVCAQEFFVEVEVTEGEFVKWPLKVAVVGFPLHQRYEDRQDGE